MLVNDVMQICGTTSSVNGNIEILIDVCNCLPTHCIKQEVVFSLKPEAGAWILFEGEGKMAVPMHFIDAVLGLKPKVQVHAHLRVETCFRMVLSVSDASTGFGNELDRLVAELRRLINSKLAETEAT